MGYFANHLEDSKTRKEYRLDGNFKDNSFTILLVISPVHFLSCWLTFLLERFHSHPPDSTCGFYFGCY